MNQLNPAPPSSPQAYSAGSEVSSDAPQCPHGGRATFTTAVRGVARSSGCDGCRRDLLDLRLDSLLRVVADLRQRIADTHDEWFTTDPDKAALRVALMKVNATDGALRSMTQVVRASRADRPPHADVLSPTAQQGTDTGGPQ